MVFTQAQKGDIREIIQETIKELLTDRTFIASIALQVTDKINIPQQIDKKFGEYKQEITNSQKDFQKLSAQVNRMEQDMRKNNVRIYGIPVSQNEEKCTIIDVIRRETKMNFTEEKIVTAYRIGKTAENGKRAILVKFSEYKFKEEVMIKRGVLKGTDIIIADDLTRENHDLLKEAVARLGKRNVWSMGGKIYFRNGNNKFLIDSTKEIERHCCPLK